MTTDTCPTSDVQLRRMDEGYFIRIPPAHYAAMEEYDLALPEDTLITSLFQLGISDVIYYANAPAILVALRYNIRNDTRPIREQIQEAAAIKHTIDEYIDDALHLWWEHELIAKGDFE